MSYFLPFVKEKIWLKSSKYIYIFSKINCKGIHPVCLPALSLYTMNDPCVTGAIDLAYYHVLSIDVFLDVVFFLFEIMAWGPSFVS